MKPLRRNCDARSIDSDSFNPTVKRMTCLFSISERDKPSTANERRSEMRAYTDIVRSLPPDMRDTWRMIVTTRPSGFVEVGLRHIETNNLIAVVSRPEYGCDWFLHCSTGRERFKTRKAALARLFAFASNLASNLGI